MEYGFKASKELRGAKFGSLEIRKEVRVFFKGETPKFLNYWWGNKGGKVKVTDINALGISFSGDNSHALVPWDKIDWVMTEDGL